MYTNLIIFDFSYSFIGFIVRKKLSILDYFNQLHMYINGFRLRLQHLHRLFYLIARTNWIQIKLLSV